MLWTLQSLYTRSSFLVRRTTRNDGAKMCPNHKNPTSRAPNPESSHQSQRLDRRREHSSQPRAEIARLVLHSQHAIFQSERPTTPGIPDQIRVYPHPAQQRQERAPDLARRAQKAARGGQSAENVVGEGEGSASRRGESKGGDNGGGGGTSEGGTGGTGARV